MTDVVVKCEQWRACALTSDTDWGQKETENLIKAMYFVNKRRIQNGLKGKDVETLSRVRDVLESKRAKV